MKVLIVEKDDSLGELLRALLENWGYDARLCTRGKEAVRLFRTGDYDLVVMELVLPDMNDVELISTLKEFSPEVGIVAMTGKNSKELEARIRGQGILYYMVKPLETENLRSLLEYVSNKAGRSKQWAAWR